MLLGFTGFYLVILSFTLLYLGFTGFYLVLPRVPFLFFFEDGGWFGFVGFERIEMVSWFHRCKAPFFWQFYFKLAALPLGSAAVLLATRFG